VRVAGRWRYVYRAIDQFGQVIDVFVSPRRDATAARRFFERAIRETKTMPVEAVIDLSPVYPATLEEVLPGAWQRTDRYGNNRLEADYGRLKARLRPLRGFKLDRSARAVIAGHGFVQNLRRGHYELSGWSLDADTGVLHAFVTDWTGHTAPGSLTRTAAEQALRRLASFLERCIDGYATKLDDSMPAWELADLLPRQINTIKEIRLYLFSDAAGRRLDLDTAREPIRVPDGGLALISIKDLQIVNGGQTTASIHHAATRDKAALDGISVQAKLTVVRPDLIDEVVPSISKFSITQNKVTGADFSANHPFHIRIEELSRTVWAPAPDGSQRCRNLVRNLPLGGSDRQSAVLANSIATTSANE
jgi:hypothetical protein